jgi:uncharacterized protein
MYLLTRAGVGKPIANGVSMQPIDIGLAVLLLHGALGVFDSLVNHGWNARLREDPRAAPELKLHALRSAFYAVIFAGLAWFEWHGAFVVLLASLVVSEFALALAGAVLADRTREVGLVEHVVHLVRGVTTGAWAGFVFFTAFAQWMTAPTALAPMFYGWVSLALTTYAAIAGLTALRDARAATAMASRARYLPPAARNRRIMTGS